MSTARISRRLSSKARSFSSRDLVRASGHLPSLSAYTRSSAARWALFGPRRAQLVAPRGERAVEEELGLEPGRTVEAPEQLDDAPRQHPLQRAPRVEVGEHVPLQLLERIHALVLQQHVAGGGQPMAESHWPMTATLPASVFGPVLDCGRCDGWLRSVSA